MSLPLLLVALLNLQPVSASLKGISLHFQGADQYGTPQSNQKIRDLQNSTGLNLVAVRQYVSLNRYDDPQLEELILPNLKNFKDHLDFLEQHSLKTAFTLGLYLKSASALPFSLRDFSLWHGTVDFDEPAKFDVFFKKYTSILQKYLRLTMLEGDLEIFTLANELNSLTTTKALDTPVRQKKFLDSLKFALNSSDADERAYIKNKIEYLLKFKLKTAPTLQARLMLDSQTNLSFPYDEQEIIASENLKRAYLKKKWIELISQLKQERALIQAEPEFSGKKPPLFTINANHDAYQEIDFWPHLDAFAVNAYFTLTDRNAVGIPVAQKNAQESIMEKHWVAAFSEMQQFKKSENLQLPTLITEVGYTPFANTTVYPWAFSGQIFYVGPGALFPQWHSISEFGVNENERVMAVHALQTAMGKAPELNFAGVFFWNAYPRSGDLYSVKADKADVYTQAISSLFQAL